jgi:hypothetical protein
MHEGYRASTIRPSARRVRDGGILGPRPAGPVTHPLRPLIAAPPAIRLPRARSRSPARRPVASGHRGTRRKIQAAQTDIQPSARHPIRAMTVEGRGASGKPNALT